MVRRCRAGRALRLTLTSAAAGTLVLQPPLAPPLAVEPGVPAKWMLPAQKQGELVLRVALAAASQAPAESRLQPGRQKADTAVVLEAVAGGGLTTLREIRLRVE